MSAFSQFTVLYDWNTPSKSQSRHQQVNSNDGVWLDSGSGTHLWNLANGEW
jgi:hypothetical protein